MTNKDGISVDGESWIERTYAASLDKPILERLKEARSSPMIYERDGWGARTCNLVAAAKAHIEAQERAYLALSEREAAKDAEIADLKQSVIAFLAPWAVSHAKDFDLPERHLHPTHYDILAGCGARMDDFTRATLTQEGKR